MQTIYLDISNKGVVPTVYAKQNDVGRKFAVILTDSGLPYIPEIGSVFSVWYKGASGEGNYTDIGNKSAFSLNGNKVEVEMIVQMLSAHGDGILCLTLNSPDGNQISSWNIPYMCEMVPGSESEKAEEYYTAFSKAVEELPYPDETLSISGKAADSAAVGKSLAKKADISYTKKICNPHNLLDNSDFRNPVNQRGLANYTKTADTGYTVDRWIKRGDTNTPLTVSDGCVSLTRTSDTAYTAIKQELDPDRYTHAGKTVTAVVKVQSVSGSAVLRITGGNASAYDSGVYASVDISSAGIFTVSTTFPKTLQYHMCGVTVALMSKGATINLEWVALYEGEYTTSTIPEYQPKGYAAELLECMRYFIRFGKTAQNNHIGYAQAATANVANAVIAIPVPMRIYNPTVIVGGTLSLRTGAVDINVTSESTNSASSGPFIYMTLNATGLTSGGNYAVRLTFGTLDLSADL